MQNAVICIIEGLLHRPAKAGNYQFSEVLFQGFLSQMEDPRSMRCIEGPKYKPYRVSEREKEINREKVNELLESVKVRELNSSYGSPAILVKKKKNYYGKRLITEI
ncbi:hypothetical protein GWI33_003764 [Rhynchophorus ferrugineus]|uniref:Uncharacterized protein n=1 Tax=Rhynchophorus ferrugineus TaxID=354439 RepID=A0A834IJ99_RHYFE|nr:hypothetical protein GWI33_003764 [Rhynchophorus ferrugineus]